jgi:serine/threonine protein kinase
VSSTTECAQDVLRAVLPALVAERAMFKVAQSADVLGALNQGDGGLSQVGKFVTVYPVDDDQAVRLATRLDAATRGLRGPAIPSDRSLGPESLVHYRYGGFGQRYLQTAMGEVLPALVAPDGGLVPDRRLAAYRPPEWVTDPFEAASIVSAPPASKPLLDDRYLLLTTMVRTPRGAVQLAIDLGQQRRCVLKRADRAATAERDGRDAQDRLHHEAAVLRMLSPDPRFPAVYDLFEHDGALYLAMEDVEGLTFEAHLNRYLTAGRLPSDRQVAVWGQALARLFGAVHAHGLVYRDVKSPNVIVTPRGQFRLIDFEMAHAPVCDGPAFGVGTPGYVSPQQITGLPPSVTDDVYGVGALLYLAATGAEPSLAPDRMNLLSRPIRRLNPGSGLRLQRVIARCLDLDPTRRFQSMSALERALRRVERETSATPREFGAESRRSSEAADRQRSRELAGRLADSLCSAAIEQPDHAGKTWRSLHRSLAGAPSRDLNAGGAGPVLVLAELVARFGNPRHRETLAEGALGLLRTPRPSGDPPTGLYVGDAGVGAALLRAGQALHDPDLVASAAACGSRIAALPHRSQDLFNGSAGRARFHLWLWDATADPRHLQDAVGAADAILSTTEEVDGGGLRWRIPPGYEGLSGSTYSGYAHGASGIADVLLDVWEATGEARFLEAARGAATWLERLALPVLGDGRGRDWPSVEGGPASGGLWCHGAAGTGRFFLHAARLDNVHPRSLELAVGAARAASRSGRWASPVQCHGLAGNIEFLLDVYQGLGDVACLREARSLARLLEAFGVERDGRLVCASESPGVYSPDFMVGYAGVAACLVRLSDPEHFPHVLSRAAFKGTSA